MCLDRKILLHQEQTAWDKFRHTRDSKWRSDDEIVQSHDIAIATSQKLRYHLAGCQRCKEDEEDRQSN